MVLPYIVNHALLRIAVCAGLLDRRMVVSHVIISVIAWLITLQCKIPVTAGPINPKLPTNLKSARLGMKSARL